MEFLYAFILPRDDLNPLDSPFLDYIPLLALFAAFTSWIPQTRSIVPPFISDGEAEQVAEKRIAAIERRTGRPVRFGKEGFARQSRRIRWILLLGTVELVGWSIMAGFTHDWLIALMTSLTWLAILTSIVLSPPQTPPLSILFSASVLLISSIVSILQTTPRLSSAATLPVVGLLCHGLDLCLLGIVLALVLLMPVTAGGWEASVDEEERLRVMAGTVVDEKEDMAENYELCPTTPEDYTSLASTLSYRWMSGVQDLALQRPLLPSDLWRLRCINDTRILYSKFRGTKYTSQGVRRGIASRLLAANLRDITLDAAYKIVAVSFSYAAPALMRQILEAIGKAAEEDQRNERREPGEWTYRSRAFAFALIALLLTLVRYIAELLNFHHARQVGLRVRSVMVAELFEKALKRRYVAGEVAMRSQQSDKSSTADNLQPGLREKAARAFKRTQRRKRAATSRVNRAEGGNADAEDVEEEETMASRLPEPSASSADIGKVVNMMSSDVNVLLRLGCDLHQLYGAPAEVLISGIFLTRLLGWSALAGFSLLVLATPLNYVQGRFSVRASRDWKGKTDRRMGLVTELLSAARFVKLQGIAAQWRDRVLEARNAEIKALLRVLFSELGFTLIFAALPIGVSLFSFFCYVKLQGNELTVPVAFTAVTLFSMVRAPLNAIPTFAMAGLNAMVAIKRLEAFLEEEEVDELISSLSGLSSSSGLDSLTPVPIPLDVFSHSSENEEPMEIHSGSFSWSRQEASPVHGVVPPKGTLRDITVSFPPLRLSVIAGPTGSGKSTLLHAILGELRRTSGSLILPKWVKIPNNSEQRSGLSYAAQTPWIEGGKSIKMNIVFNNPFNEERYKTVLFACALLDDLRLLEDGDETRVSSTTLSGGQQARVGLARALYAPSHTVLLDDPLAAVDAHVQRHIVLHALRGPIGRGRRIILVTHHVGVVLPLADYLVYLKDGTVSVQGKVHRLREQGVLTGPLAERDLSLESQEASISSSAGSSSVGLETPEEDGVEHVDPLPNKKPPRLLYDLEKRREGSVKWSYYSIYLGASSPLMWTIIIILSVALRLVASGEQYWLKVWGEASGASGRRTGIIGKLPPAANHENFYLGIYGLIGLSIVVLGVVKTIIFWLATLKASQKLYVKLLTAVLSARLRFFDINPLGRIMQRFNQDVSVMDRELPSSSVNFLNNSMALIGYLVVCAIIVPPILIPAAIFFAWGPSYVRGFLACTRDMQRIESTSTSPLYTVFASSMAAVTTIRAFGAERFRLDEMLTILDVTQAQWWAICTIEVWLSFRSQILGGFAVFLVSTLALMGAVSAGSAGMVMTSAQLLTVLSYYLCNDWKHLSNNLNSIERIAEYFDLPSETSGALGDSRSKQPPAAWPSSSGSIHIEDLCLTYDESLPDVLHNVTIDIEATQHIALVGRTGSGKTTMASALLRALEAKSGKIIIDGIDISTLDVEILRRRITLVSQSPLLFSGTVRSNLDPFDERTDEECIFALRQVRIAAYRSSARQGQDQRYEQTGGEAGLDAGTTTSPVMTLSLDAPVAAGGANFSAGEAQLLSLARALLRDARVVILDEATSSTDSETDAAIQAAIRQMRHAIVITVAHRLQTVLDYDRVLVLSQGRVLQYGPPKDLFNDPGGEFRKMCEASGIRKV